MSALVVLGIGAIGGVGAIARLLLDGAVARRAGREFPYGTLLVNAAGAFALGAVVGAAIGQNAYRLLGTGLIGSFTTFSTWALESHRLAEDGEIGLGIANVLVSLVVGLGAAWGGQHLGASL